MYNVLCQRRRVPSRLLHFPDEGHWVLKASNRCASLPFSVYRNSMKFKLSIRSTSSSSSSIPILDSHYNPFYQHILARQRGGVAEDVAAAVAGAALSYTCTPPRVARREAVAAVVPHSKRIGVIRQSHNIPRETEIEVNNTTHILF
jgi:hypothetical protein